VQAEPAGRRGPVAVVRRRDGPLFRTVVGSKLARRIVLPLLALIVGLFVVLGFAAARIAERSVAAELETEADRIADTIGGLPLPPDNRLVVLQVMTDLVGTELVVDGVATRTDWDAAAIAGVAPPRATVGGESYRVFERTAPGPRRAHCLVLFTEERVAQRRREVLGPVAVAGAAGLFVALVLGLVVARTIARPVKELADAVQGFAAGEDAPPPHRGPGEIGELYDAYVAMVKAIREGERRLLEAERFAALGRLAGGIAHELRNPLTAIRMAVETATSSDEEGRHDARRVALAEIDRLDRTLRELLDFVRPRPPARAMVLLGDLCRDAALLLAPQCSHLGVKLELDADDGGNVEGDADRIKQAVLNLVLNGAQAQPDGGAVRLHARGRTIEVADEGRGIAAEVRDTLFQPFVTTKAAGIGLGLAVVRQVVDEHGATLDLDTSERGTRFTITFPAP
jgi:signal transduction histidine kinase